MKFRPIPRRTFLRGVGASIALPMLEGMSLGNPLAESVAGATNSATTAPQRLAFFYIPNGVHMPDWSPQTEGTDFELPSILQPLEGVRDQVLVLSGLAVDNARPKGDGPGDHARSAAAFLTGRHPVKTDGRDIRAGISVDQIAGKYLGKATKFPTLEIGCEAGRLAGSCDSGYSCAYSHSISWRSESQPAGKEVNPRNLFDRMFAVGTTQGDLSAMRRRQALQQSILDSVADDARRLERRVGRADRAKLGEYLEGIREVERRLEMPGPVDQSMERPDGVPHDFANHMRLMGDLMVLAFQSDLTRVVTFMVANEGSNRKYRELEIREGHHGLSHHQQDGEKQRQISAINRYHMEQFAYILQRLSEVPEGEGTLLSNSALVYGSAICDGNAHNHDNLPILVAGQGGGQIATGRHIRYRHETPLMNLFLTLLQQNNVPVESVGDSSGTLKLA